MDQNQDFLLSELKLQRKDNFALQEDMSMIKKKMADMVIFANNLYPMFSYRAEPFLTS